MAARYRATYVEDRQHINHPEVDPGTPVTLLGKDALLWPYSADDHTVIGAADGRVYPEVRGSGMGRKAFLALLDRLVWTDQAGFEAALPDSFVTSEEAGSDDRRHARKASRWPRAPRSDASDESDPYQLGADVARQVVCPWIREYERAVGAGDERRGAGRPGQSPRDPVVASS